MKSRIRWAAAFLLLPAVYLSSCGSGSDNNNSDTISTQSAPPTADTGMATPGTSTDTSSSLTPSPDASSSVTGSTATGSTGATGNTGSEPGNTGLSSSDKTVASTTGENTVKRSTGTKSKAYKQRKRSSTGARKTSETTTERKPTTETTDTSSISRDVEQAIDTATDKTRELTDTAAKKMSELADSTRRLTETSDTLNQMSDSVNNTMRDTMNQMLRDTSMINDTTNRFRDSSLNSRLTDSSVMNNMDTTVPQTEDTSRTFSTPQAGINFTPSIFIPDQIRGNYAEIKMARMAIDKSQNEDVKRIATTLENDHNSLLRELQTLAMNSSTARDSVPTSESEMSKQHLDMMKNYSGQEFDRQWLQHMYMMHDQKVQAFEQAETNNSIQDAQLRIWINKTLPTLRKHRDMLKEAMNSTNK